MLDNMPSNVPMAPKHYRDEEVASDQDKVALTPPEHETFRAILGSVNFICMCIRHDVAFAINVNDNESDLQHVMLTQCAAVV
jgi:hypothetical protein